jgi:ElaB/YqjD/DUF883 family membrane-anchored ribosome-binding protein
VAEAQEWLNRLPDNVSGVMDATRRTFKRGIKSAEQISDDARHQVKRHPFTAAAISLGAGIGAGLLVGWAATRRRRSWLLR